MSTTPRPELLLYLLREAAAKRDTIVGKMLPDLMEADCVVVGPKLAYMAESLRTDDLGVTVRSWSEACFPPGKSWWEWNTSIPGRLPPHSPETSWDLSGVLVDTDHTGQKGTMFVMVRAPHAHGAGRPTIGGFPIGTAFDFREDAETLPSLFPRATPVEIEDYFNRVRDPTPGEVEASSLVVAAMERHTVAIENPYVRGFGPPETKWRSPEEEETRLATMWMEMSQETTMLMCLQLCLLGASLEKLAVVPERRPKHLPRKKSACPVAYTFMEAG